MSSVNKVILIGHLGADPEVRRTNSGDPIANLRVATTEKWKDKQTSERQERTEWHTVAIFGPVAEVAEKYLRKGSKVYLEGQLQTRKWQDRDGNDRYSTEVVLRGPRATMAMLDGPSGSPGEPSQQREPRGGRPVEDFTSDTLADDIPFASWD